MAKPGEAVTYYTHESWDNNHRTVDWPAIVMVADNDRLVLKVFQPGTAPFDAEVWPFDEKAAKDGKAVNGQSYWRAANAKAPDFGKAFPQLSPAETARLQLEAAAKQERETLEAKHRTELDELAGKDVNVLKERQAQEKKDLEARLKVPPAERPFPGMPDPNAPQASPRSDPTVTNSLPKVQ